MGLNNKGLNRWCKLYNEEPNNELVLTIKRRHWNCIANQVL